jgi:hypothetical protein
LPGYLSDSEADGVSVINWYHRQFRDAAKIREDEIHNDTNKVNELYVAAINIKVCTSKQFYEQKNNYS